MKPVHIGLLVAAGAFGGALFMKFTQKPQPAPAPPAVVAQAPAPAAPPAAEAAKPAEPLPSPFEEKKEPEKPRRSVSARHARPAEKPIAQSQPPAPAATPSPAAEPARPAPAPTPAATPAPAVEPEHVAPPPPPPPHKVTLTAGTTLPVRLVEGLSSDRNQAGDQFTATLDAPLVVDGFVIAERGARLEGRVVESEKAGRVRGVSSLAIELTRLTTSDGQHVPIQTETFTKQGEKTVGKDAAKVGAAAGIGAAIGAIAGGGKGAAIGAAVGGAAGTGGVLATRGEASTLRAETRLNFRLREPVTITERRR